MNLIKNEAIILKFQSYNAKKDEKNIILSNQKTLNEQLEKKIKEKGKLDARITYLKKIAETEEEQEKLIKALSKMENIDNEIRSLKVAKSKNMENLHSFLNLFPELISSFTNSASKQGILVKRSLKEFNNQRPHPFASNIILADKDGKTWALKVHLLVGNQNQFEREISIIGKLKHPLILQVIYLFVHSFFLKKQKD